MISKNKVWTKSIFKDIYGLLIITVILFGIGLIAILDLTSAQPNPVHPINCFVKRQSVYFLTGLLTMFAVIKIRDRIKQLSNWMGLLSIILFLLPVIPGFWNTNTPYGTVNHIRILGSQISVDYWIIPLAFPFLASKIHQVHLKISKPFSIIFLCMGLLIINFFLLCRPYVAMLLLFDSIAIIMLMTSPLTIKEKLIISPFIIVLPLLQTIMLFSYQPTVDHFFINEFYFQKWWEELYLVQTNFCVSDFETGGLWGGGFGSYQVKPPLFVKWRTLEHYILQVTVKQFGLVGLFCVINLYLLMAFNRIKSIVSSLYAFDRCIKTGALSFIMLQALFNILKTTNVFSFAGYYIPPFIGFGVDGMISNFFTLGLLFSSTEKK